MNSELRELFEIKQEDQNKKISQPPSDQNMIDHMIVRLAVIIIVTLVFGIAINEAKGWDGLALLMLMAVFHTVCLIFMIVEAVILHNRKKFILRNVNLVFILILLLIYGIGGIFLVGFA